MLKINIQTNNAAFNGEDNYIDFECARILRELADKLDNQHYQKHKGVKTMLAVDHNGNYVGQATLTNR